MEKKFENIICVVLIILILAGLCFSSNMSASAHSIANGECGDTTYEGGKTNAQYTLYSDNILVISGDDATANYSVGSPNSTAPWNAFYDYTNYGFMQKIVVANGITRIGNYSFFMNPTNNYQVNLINLPDSLVTIGNHAFCNEKKLESITIPQNVTSIGDCAFDGCATLKNVNLYAKPNTLNWAIENSGLDLSTVKIHVMSNDLANYQSKYSTYSSCFAGDLTEPTNVVPNGKNILVSYDDPSPSILAGALPYSIKNVNTKGTWPITYGARGFVTCIKVENDYYALTNNNNSTLGHVYYNTTSGKASHIIVEDDELYKDVSLKLSHEYIGANSIKIIYTVKNNTAESKTFKLGSSGDIKIGNDDYAAIAPLNNDTTQIGITMTSSNSDDKVDDQSPTLGFAGKKVGGSAADVNYFYGAVGANKSDSATGVKSDIFIPERIFAEGSEAKNTGEFSGYDSGLSFYWDISLEANTEKQYAVIFSVPNTSTGSENDTVINEVKSNIGSATSETTYTTSDGKEIFFNNELIPRSDDPIAEANKASYSSYKNFLIVGVLKKPEMTERNAIRFVSVVNTEILKDAKEYGYIVAKKTKSEGVTYESLREKIDQIKIDSSKVYVENVKGTSNKISSIYGQYDSDTPYKYVTLGINDVPEDVILLARFYVKDKSNNIQYADYYTQIYNDAYKYKGCSMDWAAVNV